MIRRKSSRRIVRRSSSSMRNYPTYQPRVVRSLPLRAVHFCEAAFPSNSCQSNPIGVLLNGIPKGSSIYMRSGNRIKMLSLLISGGILYNPFRIATDYLANSGTHSGQSHFHREANISLVLMYCPAPQLAIPPLSDYYSPSPSSGVVDTWSMRRVVEMPTMRLLKRLDFTLKTRPVGATQVGSPSQWHAISVAPPALDVKLAIPLNLMSSYSNVTGTGQIGDITGGALFMFLLGDYTGIAGINAPNAYQVPQFKGEVRLSFTNID